MCRDHWRRVPRPVAAEVNDAWRSYLSAIRSRPLNRETALAARARYHSAARTAIEALQIARV